MYLGDYRFKEFALENKALITFIVTISNNCICVYVRFLYFTETNVYLKEIFNDVYKRLRD